MSTVDRCSRTEADAGTFVYATSDGYDDSPTRAELEAEEADQRDPRDDMTRCPHGCAVWFHHPHTYAAQRHIRVVHEGKPQTWCNQCGQRWPYGDRGSAARWHAADTGHPVFGETPDGGQRLHPVEVAAAS